MYLLYWVGHQKRSSWSMFYDFLSFLYENFLTLNLYYTCGLSETCTYRTLLFYFAAWNTWIPKQTIFSDHFKMSTHITILNFINYRGALCCTVCTMYILKCVHLLKDENTMILKWTRLVHFILYDVSISFELINCENMFFLVKISFHVAENIGTFR